MRGFKVIRDRASALSLCFALAVLGTALGGCAVETASGDPSATTEQDSAEPAASAAKAGATGAATAEAKPGVPPAAGMKSAPRWRTETSSEPLPWAPQQQH